MTARWYVVNVYSGSEKKVADSIKEQAVQKKLEDKILDVLVPMETIVDTKKSLKKGEKVNAERKFFPGDRKSTRLNSSHIATSRMPSSA